MWKAGKESFLPGLVLGLHIRKATGGIQGLSGMSRVGQGSSVPVTALMGLLCRCRSVCSRRNKQNLSRAGKGVTAIKGSKED